MERACDYPNLMLTQWFWGKNSNRDCTQLVLLLTLEPPPALKACLGFVLSWSVMPLASACTTLPLRCLSTWSSAMSWLAALWRPLADQAPRGWACRRMFVTRGIPENASPKDTDEDSSRDWEDSGTKGKNQRGVPRANFILGSCVSPHDSFRDPGFKKAQLNSGIQGFALRCLSGSRAERSPT